MERIHFSKSGNLVVELNSNWQGETTGRKLLYKKEILVSNKLPLNIEKLKELGYTRGGYSALDWLLNQIAPDKILSNGYTVR